MHACVCVCVCARARVDLRERESDRHIFNIRHGDRFRMYVYVYVGMFAICEYSSSKEKFKSFNVLMYVCMWVTTLICCQRTPWTTIC